MNFEDHEKKIQRLCLLPDRRASKGKTAKTVAQYHKGVYLISRDVDDVCYKIGVAYGAGGLFQRLKQYKHCFPYPTEYYLQYLFLSATGEDAKELEKIILKIKAFAKIEENPSAEGRACTEHRLFPNKDVLTRGLIKVLDANPNLWTHAVLFGEKGWELITNNGDSVKGLARPRNSLEKTPYPYEAAKVDTYIPKVATPVKIEKGKEVWVVDFKDGAKVAIKGKLDGLVNENGAYIHFPRFKNAFAYELNDVFATKAEAEANFNRYKIPPTHHKSLKAQ